MVIAEKAPSQASRIPSLADEYSRVRGASLALIGTLEPEDCVIQTIPEVSPIKWHLAHVTWFFEQFCLLEHDKGYSAYDEDFLYLFNSYYYSVGSMHCRAERGLLSRPSLADVLAYRAHVDDSMLELMNTRCDDSRLALTVALGLHHEQQHQELLLTDIKHVFHTNPLGPAYAAPRRAPRTPAVPLAFIDRPGGQFEIGHEGAGFCFDNETPRHALLVAAHSLANRLVTNREYREFIEAGGYAESSLWLSDGWASIREHEWTRPLYWSDDLEAEFTLNGWQPIDAESPVCHVSQYEADAYARWAGARLPLEAEWELAAARSAVRGNTLDHGYLQPRAASDPDGDGFYQLWGDVWEWTASPYTPYPRFKPLAGSLGEYNGKFMSNQTVVRGGSCATWSSHLRATYRSFFYPRDRWQFLGIRLARDLP